MKKNLYKEITRMVIDSLKQGVGPWIKPWAVEPHKNPVRNYPYKGVNVLLLNLSQMKRGFSSVYWLTYKEAKRLGGYVRPGECGTKIVFWKKLEVVEKDENGSPILDPETGEPKIKAIPLIRYYTVFNVEQCEGIKISTTRVSFHNKEKLEKLFRLSQVKIISGGNRAFYRPREDCIVLPPVSKFESEDYFWTTFLHELVHWTAPRLGRDFSGRFGSRAYAMEELVAEMGSAFLAAHVGLPVRKLRHPEYINAWLEVLEDDRTYRAVFTAARKAQEACDYLLRLAGEMD